MFCGDCLAVLGGLFCYKDFGSPPPPGSLARATLQTSEEAPRTPTIPTACEEAFDGACVVCRSRQSAKTTQAALGSHPGHNTSTLMEKIRKITTGPDTATETEETGPILDGSEMALGIETVFECCLGSAKMAATLTGSGRSTDRTASNEMAKAHSPSAGSEGATWMDMAFANHHGRADMPETEHKARVDAGFGRMVGMDAAASDSGKAAK